MKVLLSEQCLSLTGMLERGLGYFLQARRTKSGKVNYYSQRSKHGGPPDGQWRFIVLCAELAHNGLYITDIQVDWAELTIALRKAHHFIASDAVFLNGERHIKILYNARDILNLKTTYSL